MMQRLKGGRGDRESNILLLRDKRENSDDPVTSGSIDFFFQNSIAGNDGLAEHQFWKSGSFLPDFFWEKYVCLKSPEVYISSDKQGRSCYITFLFFTL